MNNVNKTLYIPLYGKAYVSRKGVILRDPKAEEIWEAEGFALKGKAKSKWLAYYMGMRSAVFDRWLEEKLREYPDAVVLHLGCGLDSRCLRVRHGGLWLDVDFPEVIRERQRHYREEGNYRMVGADLRQEGWLAQVPRERAVVVMEGVSMYLTSEERNRLLKNLGDHFSRVELLMDCYTVLAAKATKYKNPINQVGVTEVHGLDDPAEPAKGTALRFMEELDMTPPRLIGELKGLEQTIFRKVFAGSFSRKLYRLYAYRREVEA